MVSQKGGPHDRPDDDQHGDQKTVNGTPYGEQSSKGVQHGLSI
jgi:hypothetical protein